MALTQQPMERTTVIGLNAVLGNISSIGRKAQAIVGEFAKMSEENLAAGSKAAERMRGATSLHDITSIQTELMKESLECATNHYRKIAEIAASTPQEIAQGYSQMLSAATEAGQEVAQKATDTARDMGDQASQAAHKTADAVRGTAEAAQRPGR